MPTPRESLHLIEPERTLFLRVLILFLFYFWASLSLFPTILFAVEGVRGEEPSRWEQVWGFSDLWELGNLGIWQGRWSGSSVWRFRSDKPNAETFGNQTDSDYDQPFYLYNRTDLNWASIHEPGRQILAGFVAIRRDETASGASEPAAVWKNADLLFRHGGLIARAAPGQAALGDLVIGWGQGLAVASYKGVSYRSWIESSHQTKIGINRSYYENTGWRGFVFDQKSEDDRSIVAIAQTPLNGDLSDGGQFSEDYAVIDETSYGEYGDDDSLDERHALKENSILWRHERSQGDYFVGANVAWSGLSRVVDPMDTANVEGFGQNDGYFFRGNDLGLMSADGYWRGLGESQIFWETSLSKWQSHEALAWMTGLKRREPFKVSAGIFRFSPYYVSRWADGVRWDSSPTRNREGLFYSSIHETPAAHEIGMDAFVERNLESEFTGYSSSHGPPDSRWTLHLRADDQWKLSKIYSLYGRFDLEAAPYFIDPKDDPRVARILEGKWRIQLGRDNEKLSQAWGIDHVRARSLADRAEAGEGKLFYWRARYERNSHRRFYGKLVYFDVGSALYGNRYLYMSSPEIYWRESTLASIAYQSLFASYAPRGWRLAAAVEQRASPGLTLWMKWGNTSLAREDLSVIPQNTSERDDYANLLRWDFKTEVAYQW